MLHYTTLHYTTLQKLHYTTLHYVIIYYCTVVINVDVCGQVLDQSQHLECQHSKIDSELTGVSYFPTAPYLIFRQEIKIKNLKETTLSRVLKQKKVVYVIVLNI